VRREPPLAAPSALSAPLEVSSPAQATAAPSENQGDGELRFRVVVAGIDRRWLSRWWRELCEQDLSKAPQAFRDIHPNLLSFEGGAYTFKGGDPSGTRDRLAYLLEIYGASDADVHLDKIH
jgi:hypothetical protein